MGVWILLLVLLAAAALLLRIERARRRRPTLPPGTRTLFDLRTGDIVQAGGRDWVVEDRLLYDDDGFQWLEYLLRDGPEARWLVVCEDDWLEVSWLEAGPEALVRQLEAEPDPFPPVITWEGVAYALREQGSATATSSSRTMNRRLSACRYGDYEAPGQRLLAVERWGDDPPEITVGERIDPAAPVLLPGDGRSVYRPAS
jgi:hypothetical protein